MYGKFGYVALGAIIVVGGMYYLSKTGDMSIKINGTEFCDCITINTNKNNQDQENDMGVH